MLRVTVRVAGPKVIVTISNGETVNAVTLTEDQVGRWERETGKQ